MLKMDHTVPLVPARTTHPIDDVSISKSEVGIMYWTNFEIIVSVLNLRKVKHLPVKLLTSTRPRSNIFLYGGWSQPDQSQASPCMVAEVNQNKVNHLPVWLLKSTRPRSSISLYGCWSHPEQGQSSPCKFVEVNQNKVKHLIVWLLKSTRTDLSHDFNQTFMVLTFGIQPELAN